MKPWTTNQLHHQGRSAYGCAVDAMGWHACRRAGASTSTTASMPPHRIHCTSISTPPLVVKLICCPWFHHTRVLHWPCSVSSPASGVAERSRCVAHTVPHQGRLL